MAAQKVALITAGTAGLGAQVARTLAPDFRLAINYANNTSRANELISSLKSIPNTHSTSPTAPRFHAIQADVSSRHAITSLVNQTISTFGRLDVVISNAGWTRLTNFHNLSEQLLESDWETCMQYNILSHLYLVEACRPHLEENEEGGNVVVTASIAGVKPSGSSLPYAVSKAAAIHLAKSLSVICAPKIRVNSISPGLLLTDWGLKFGEERIATATKATRLGRLATVEDVAEQVRVLAMTKSMTGQNICIDSGMSV